MNPHRKVSLAIFEMLSEATITGGAPTEAMRAAGKHLGIIDSF
jgi:hypothetical protein